jgi:hypothetical protein
LVSRFHIWGGEKLIAWLNEFPHIARRFGHFLTPGHVISALLSQLNDDRSSVEDIVRYTVVRGIEEQRQTRLEQAGSTEDRRPGIDALFVDLPYADGRCNTRGKSNVTLAHASARNHRADDDDDSVTENNWRVWRAHPKRSGIWFIRAGPGRGKSSIGQFFCQVQRAALILQPGGIRVHRDVKLLAERIRDRAQGLGCWPSVPRIPLWVELKNYAAWFADQRATAPRGVVSFLCSVIHRDTEAVVHAKTLRRALAELSWAIVFDGLDEVPSDVKDTIASEILTFARDTSVLADILFICTSRPQGYAGQFDALGGAVVDLVDLPPELALECASKVAAADRSHSEATRAHGLLSRALQSPAVRELLTTPLQAHIMAVLVRNGQRPPERKWDLYHKFYEVIREREGNRELPDPTLRTLFQRDPGLIDAVHQKLGFALHKKAETATGADASLSRSEFRALVEAVVRDARDATEVAPIVAALVRATTERLVLINTPDQGDRVRFDIRAIQEFFAAEYVYVDTPADVLAKRLELIAGDSHWREVVQFVLGALTALKRATEWTVALDVLRTLDSGEPGEAALARRLARGALHAALFFDNGAAEQSRKVRDQLRPIVDAISESSDRTLLEVMGRVSSPESRVWLMAWAKDEVRRLQPSQSSGALHILADLLGPGISETQDFLELLDTLDTKQVGDLLYGQFSREQRRTSQADYRTQWVLEAETRLLRRDDCVSNAPALVARLISQAGWQAGGRPNIPRKQTRQRSTSASVPSIGDSLARLFHVGHVSSEREFSLVVRRDYRLGTNFKPIVTESTSGLLRWLHLVHEAATQGGVARTSEALSWLGTDWTVAHRLPGDLAQGLPMPSDPRITPATMSRLLQNLTDEQYAKCRVAGRINGTRLRRPEPFLFGFTESEPSESFITLARDHPWAAWSAWCFYWGRGTHFVSPMRPSNDLLQKDETLAAVRQQLAAVMESEPFIALDQYTPFLLSGLAALGDQLDRVLIAFQANDLRWFLRFNARFGYAAKVPISLTLPDARLLPIIAEREFSAAWDSLRPADAIGERRSKEATEFVWTIPGNLHEVLGSSTTTMDERAAALLLIGLKQKDGWSHLVDSRPQLQAFAEAGLPVAYCVAVAAEICGRWSSSEARRLVSELIETERTARIVDVYGERQSLLNSVIHAWRERSTAPLATGGTTTNLFEQI